MNKALRLASGSSIRREMLERAGVSVIVDPARVDEDAVREALIAEQARPREIADALAELKARKIGERNPEGLTLGADQVLEIDGQILTKAEDQEQALAQLTLMNGKEHRLYSAAVIYENAKPVWRHIGEARMKMRMSSPDYLAGYVSRNWPTIRHSVGCYLIEDEGIRLFEKIGTDFHAILGLPLLPLLNYLTVRGVIET